AQVLARAWVVTPTPSGQPGADIHNQATQRCTPVAPPAAAAATPAVSSAPLIGAPLAVDAPPATAPQHESPQPPPPLPRPRSLLPLLGGLLVMALLAGAVLAA